MSKWKNENWSVSHYNWLTEVKSNINPSKEFNLHDVSMRDGAHVVDYSEKERIQLTSNLSDLGVKRIEIESRASTIKKQSIYPPEEHWKTLKNIANMGLPSKIFTMRNVSEGYAGIDKALQCDITNIELQEPVQEGWLKRVGQTKEERIEIINDVVSYAKNQGCYVTFFNNHIGLSKLDYFLQIVKTGMDAGADAICITDSEGIATPQTFSFLVKKVLEVTEGTLPVEVHPHNDFGLALANTVSSYAAGASVAHCCLNNLGSRAGNTALEEIVIAFHVLYGVDFGINYQKLYSVIELVERMQQWPLAKNKPFYGYGVNEGPYKLDYFGKKPHTK
jgi:methanogen homocitrate synthase